jgi:hypothetical protein
VTFAVSAESWGSKSDTSAGRISDQRVTELLGMNSASRTSFVNDSAPALGSKNVEAYAEQPILKHDPGKATTPTMNILLRALPMAQLGRIIPSRASTLRSELPFACCYIFITSFACCSVCYYVAKRIA